jgi:hypothetical protein
MRAVLVCLLLLSGCAKQHAVMPTPKDWTPPPALAHCAVEETIRWPNHVRTVLLRCPERYVFVGFVSKAEVDVDSLDFRRSKGWR